jgi:hypothetical protein
MTQRRQRLQRLLAIRRIGEDVERRRLQSALASLAEAETVLSDQRQATADASDAASSALRSANRGEWLFAEAQAEVAGWNRARLAPVLESRRAAIPPATAAFLQRRREAEQMQQLVENSLVHEQFIEDRKAQAAADDWFLGQRRSKRK